MNEENIANKRTRELNCQINSKRKSVPNRNPPFASARWPVLGCPLNCAGNGYMRPQVQMYNIWWTSSCGNTCMQHQSASGSSRGAVRGWNTQIFQPKPIKFKNIQKNHLESWNFNQRGEYFRLERNHRINDYDIWDEFTQELEDKIEADLEVESILESVPQIRSLSQGKLMPERPGNPIINDKFFKWRHWDLNITK